MHNFTSLKTDLIFLQPRVLEQKIPIELVYHYMVISLNFSTTSNHLHPLQVENCDSNSRLVVDEDDNDNFRLERVKMNPFRIKIMSYVSILHAFLVRFNICVLSFRLGKIDCISHFCPMSSQAMSIYLISIESYCHRLSRGSKIVCV